METYVRLPNSMFDIRINNRGEIKSFETDYETPNIYTNRKGYLTSWYKSNDSQTVNYLIHRFVALFFIPIPDRLKDVPLRELHVNHIDGDKNNNTIDNLEWMTNVENMQHARENGLFSDEKPVLALCVSTGVITRYKSLTDTCKAFNIKPSVLSIHLNQKVAGCIFFDGHRFKFDNGKPWCELKLYPGVVEGLGYQYKVKAVNTQTGEQWLLRSFSEVQLHMGLNVNIIKNIKQRTGVYRTNDGLWVFEIDHENKLTPKPLALIGYNRGTGEVRRFRTSRCCAKELGVEHAKLLTHVNTYYAGMLPWKGYYLKLDNGDSFPEVEYLIPEQDALGKVINFIVYKDGDNKPYLLTNLVDFCQHFGFKPHDIYHHRERVGREIPFNGFLIVDVSNIEISKLTDILKVN